MTNLITFLPTSKPWDPSDTTLELADNVGDSGTEGNADPFGDFGNALGAVGKLIGAWVTLLSFPLTPPTYVDPRFIVPVIMDALLPTCFGIGNPSLESPSGSGRSLKSTDWPEDSYLIVAQNK